MHIPNQHPNEKIILVLRRHWLILLGKLVFWALAALAPLGVGLMIQAVEFRLVGAGWHALCVLFLSVYYLYVWLFAFSSFVDYYLDVWVVTTDRIVNIEQHALFARTVSEQKIERVQDVTAELRGVFSTFFDYGTVYIQTAGEQARFTFKQIPDPNGVARKVIAIAEERKRFKHLLETDEH